MLLIMLLSARRVRHSRTVVVGGDVCEERKATQNEGKEGKGGTCSSKSGGRISGRNKPNGLNGLVLFCRWADDNSCVKTAIKNIVMSLGEQAAPQLNVGWGRLQMGREIHRAKEGTD